MGVGTLTAKVHEWANTKLEVERCLEKLESAEIAFKSTGQSLERLTKELLGTVGRDEPRRIYPIDTHMCVVIEFDPNKGPSIELVKYAASATQG